MGEEPYNLMFNSKEIDRKIDELLLKEPTPENLNIIGDLFLKKGDKKRAVDYFLRAAKNTAMPKKAIALYKKILRISPLDTEIYEALIDILERSYNIPAAIKYLDLLSQLYRNKGETLKFAEIQRRMKALRHDWERTITSRGVKRSKETESVSLEPVERGDQDLEYIEEVVRGIKKERFLSRRSIWIGAISLLTASVLMAIFLLRNMEKMPREYQSQKRAGNYEVRVSSVTESFIKGLPSNMLRPEDMKKTHFNRINIKAIESCIPEGIVSAPYDYIFCLNKGENEARPLSSPVTEISKKIIYRYGVCSRGSDAVFVEFLMACPSSHSSGIKINGLLTEPLVISWDKR